MFRRRQHQAISDFLDVKPGLKCDISILDRASSLDWECKWISSRQNHASTLYDVVQGIRDIHNVRIFLFTYVFKGSPFVSGSRQRFDNQRICKCQELQIFVRSWKSEKVFRWLHCETWAQRDQSWSFLCQPVYFLLQLRTKAIALVKTKHLRSTQGDKVKYKRRWPSYRQSSQFAKRIISLE